MISAFKLLPLAWRLGLSIGLIVTVLGTLGGLYAYVHHQGYADGYAKAHAECEADRNAKEAANRKAVSDAEKRLARAADDLSLKSLELDDAVTQTDAAAAADPDGALSCLPADGVRRLNAIR